MNSIEAQVQSILAAITKRYVMTGEKIPPEVLTLKDEVMDIFVKAKQETDSVKLRQFEQRLAEIHEIITTQ